MHCIGKYFLIVKEDKVSVSITGSCYILVLLVFIVFTSYSFWWPLSLGVSTVPKMKKKEQKNAPI